MLEIKEINSSKEYQLGFQTEGSFLQSFEYGQMQKKLGYQPLYLQLKGENLLQSVLVILFKAKRGTYLFAPYLELEGDDLKDLVSFLKDWGKKHQVDFIRISPLLDDKAEFKKQFEELGFRDAPVHMMHPELLWLLDISLDEKKLLEGMRKNTRYALKQAQKLPIKLESGVSEELLKRFHEIHTETAKRQHFVPYSWEYLKAQLDCFGPGNNLKIFVAEYEGKDIAAAVIMYFGGEGIYHHGASLSEFNKIPASYLIQWEAIKEAKNRQMKKYNFWGVVENAPKHPWAGLSFFKQGFGGEGRAVIHAQDLPLSIKYWFNFLVESFRRWKRGY